MTLYEMGIARWKETWSLWVETIENIFSWRKISNLKLLFKYIVIEHVAIDCSIWWNVFNYWKKDWCEVLKKWKKECVQLSKKGLMWGFEKMEEGMRSTIKKRIDVKIWKSGGNNAFNYRKKDWCEDLKKWRNNG
jgi:hypothetical protein